MELGDGAGICRSDGIHKTLEFLATPGYEGSEEIGAEDVLAIIDGGYFFVDLTACECDCEQRGLPGFVVLDAYLARFTDS